MIQSLTVLEILDKYFCEMHSSQWGRTFNTRDARQRLELCVWLRDGLIDYVIKELRNESKISTNGMEDSKATQFQFPDF